MGRSGGQTVDTRSTSGVAPKSLGYNGSNELLGRSVASKLSPQQAGKKNSRAAMEFREKRKFFSLRPPARKRKEISGWVRWLKLCPHIGQQMHCRQTVAAGSFCVLPARSPKIGSCCKKPPREADALSTLQGKSILRGGHFKID